MGEERTASDARRARASAVAEVYTARPDVAAVLVVGSVARGWADRWSDLELLVCWTAIPTESDLATLADRAGAGSRRVFSDAAAQDAIDEEWRVDELKVDVLHRTVSAIDRTIADVVDRHDTGWAKQAQVGAIQSGLVLHGERLVVGWRGRSTFPEALARAMVAAHLAFGPHAWLQMLAERDDALYLFTLCGEVERRIVGVLFGLNRVYPPAGDTKWAMRAVGELAIAPPMLADRLAAVFRSDPREGVGELGRVVDEVIALVEAYMPEIDTRAVRTRVAERRPVWGEAGEAGATDR